MQKRDSIWIAFLILAGMLAGWCLLNHTGKRKEVIMAGSVAMETFAEAITEQAEKLGVEAKAEYIGSSAGIEALIKGKVQIAMVSRYLTEEEKNAWLQSDETFRRDWDEKYGDRMIRLVFIGQHLDKHAIKDALDRI